MFGPKKTSLLACFPICLSWFLMAVAPNMATILASRCRYVYSSKFICTLANSTVHLYFDAFFQYDGRNLPNRYI